MRFWWKLGDKLEDYTSAEASAYTQPWSAILETNNPLDVTADDLEELAGFLEAAVSQASIEIGYQDQHGAGVTGHEILLMWVPHAESLRDNLYAALIVAAIAWLRKRFKRKHGEHRAKVLTVYDASTGQPLQTWVLRDADSEPDEEEPEPMRRPIPIRRPRGKHRKS
jgi:hypothetical protein